MLLTFVDLIFWSTLGSFKGLIACLSFGVCEALGMEVRGAIEVLCVPYDRVRLVNVTVVVRCCCHSC